MSDLKQLRTWLNLPEAYWYIKDLGIKGTQEDLFHTYVEGFPLRVAPSIFFIAEPDPIETGFPFAVEANFDAKRQVYVYGEGTLFSPRSLLRVFPNTVAHTFFSDEDKVWVENPATLEETRSLLYVMDMDDTFPHFGDWFRAVTWGELRIRFGEYLRLERKEIEFIANTAANRGSSTTAEAAQLGKEPKTKEEQEPFVPPAAHVAIAGLLQLIKQVGGKRFTQDYIADQVRDITESIRGTSKSQLTKLFASANKVLADVKKE